MNKNIKLILNYVAGPLLFLFLFFTVYRQIHRQHDWREALHQILVAVSGKQQWKLWLVTALMFFNWGFETVKWQIALKSLQSLSFFTAYKAVFAGITVASFTPNRIGEYLGRMIFVDEGKKIQSVAPTIVCSIAQMIVTLILGSVGIYYLRQYLGEHPRYTKEAMLIYLDVALYISIGSAILLLTVYLGFRPIVHFINRFMVRYFSRFSIPSGFSSYTLFRILLFSLIRYMVFILQYYLLFSLFGVSVNGLQAFTGVSVMFVVMAIVPTMTFLTDLGLRWETGIQVFQVFTINTTGIFAVSLGIWLINLIIPALIGSLLILRIKLFSSR